MAVFCTTAGSSARPSISSANPPLRATPKTASQLGVRRFASTTATRPLRRRTRIDAKTATVVVVPSPWRDAATPSSRGTGGASGPGATSRFVPSRW